ncbi:MAG: hypothetical protein ACOX5R_19535 [bacterium]
MTLYNHLAHAPHEQLRRIAHEFGIAALSPSKRNLLHTISKHYRDADFMAEIVRDIPQEAKGILQALVFFTPVNQEQFHIPEILLSLWTKEMTLRDVLEILQDKGLLFGEISQHNPRVIIPTDLRNLLRAILGSVDSHLNPIDSVRLPEHPFPHGMIDAIFHLLSIFYHFKAQLTQKGNIHRRIYERWLLRCHPSIAHESIFNFAFEFCKSHNLVVSKPGVYRPSSGCTEWFSRGRSRMHHDLWEFLLTSRVMPSREWQNLLVILSAIPASSDDEALGLVFSVDELHTRLKKSIHPVKEEDFNLIQALQLLGAMDVIQLDHWTSPTMYSFTSEGLDRLWGREVPPVSEDSRQEACILQPTFQILVPPTVGYDRLWRLDQIAEFRRTGYFYRVPPGSEYGPGCHAAGVDSGDDPWLD